ncbi:MAG: dienelactone hydrolase family protein [Deltaproteobacteria bacterium]|nr:dienelactone hydrolase family protein [Deltaproteobacteria bacterium]
MKRYGQLSLYFAILLSLALALELSGCGDNGADERGVEIATATRFESGRARIANSKAQAGEKGENNVNYSVRLPAPLDYSAPGPFNDAVMVRNAGPGNDYTLFRPGASLGSGGFKHPIVSWGNGIVTTPEAYETTLTLVATHGFVVIASNSRKPEEPALSAGLDWLVRQNSSSGELNGHLDTSREATVGYSWGAGAAIDAAHRPNVRCTVSLQGMPPRSAQAFNKMHGPLLLITSTEDRLVSPSRYVTPTFNNSKVPTFYATLDELYARHLYIVDEGSFYCVASVFLGNCMSARRARAPLIAWLRLWIYEEDEARSFFYGDDCVLCNRPWTNPRRKHWR